MLCKCERAFQVVTKKEDTRLKSLKCSLCNFENLEEALSCQQCDFHLCSLCQIPWSFQKCGSSDRNCCIFIENLSAVSALTFGLLQTKRIALETPFCRGYCTEGCPAKNRSTRHTVWGGQLGGRAWPYYCPSRWYRFALKFPQGVIDDWNDWRIFYHGTEAQTVHKILENGFQPRKCQHEITATYLSPSIIYASHPRYARVYHQQGYYAQVVLEVRVQAHRLQLKWSKETLNVGGGVIDPNYPDNIVECLVSPPAQEQGFIKHTDGIVVTGLMVRLLAEDPTGLPCSWWWTKWQPEHALRHFFYVPRIESALIREPPGSPRD
jgi:hypothetical protein